MGLPFNGREPVLSDDSWVSKLQELYSDSLAHYGVGWDENPPGRGSGRYPHGSGERTMQRINDIYSRTIKLRKEGWSDVEIAKALGFYMYDRKGKIIYDKDGEPIGNSATLKRRYQIAKDSVRNERVTRAIELSETIDPDTGKLYTNKKIGEILGGEDGPITESTIRNYITNYSAAQNSNKTVETANFLKEKLSEGGYIDIGRGAELSLGVSPDRLKTSLELLSEEGYAIREVRVPQQGGMHGEMTTIKLLCPPGTTAKEAYNNVKNDPMNYIRLLEEGGSAEYTRLGIKDPVRVDLSRINVKFDEDGGSDRDGMIQIRAKYDEHGNIVPACEDLSLGNAKYCQVRIATEGDHYIKGMAVYDTNLTGCDILVNSNKSKEVGKVGALKDFKKDKAGNIISDNPFGTTVWQVEYAPGKLSAINIVSDIWGSDKHQEGAYANWSKNLPAQFLAKQSESLIRQQLKLKVQEKQQEYEEIISLNNPVVKKQMLLDFAESCDAAACDLKAAPLPGQGVHVILSVPSLKDNEVYAPNYDDGQTLALVRFPHTGPFETPIVKVNNRNKEANGFMKDALDAVGVNPKTASILSGADFDGDTVICIPMTRKNSQGEFEKTVNIKGIGNGQEKLPGLEGFNPQKAYPYKEGMKVMDTKTKGREMGVVSNLITDMSIKGCDDPNELARAVKYSMVVIDAQKHHLNYKQAEKDYKIKELKDKYQVNADGTHGVSTLLSRAKSPTNVPKRELWDPDRKWKDPETGEIISAIDPKTGAKNYKQANDLFYDPGVKVKKLASPEYKATHPNAKYEKDEKGNYIYETYDNGKTVYEPTGKQSMRTVKVPKMSTKSDAYELLSDNPSPKEILYADFANKMKSMANQSRKEYLSVPKLEMNSEAKKKYSAEIASLNEKYINAKRNAPKERKAQALATQIVNEQKDKNPDMSAEELKRARGQALNGARSRIGAKKDRVTFTEKEWEAINAGAISETMLTNLLKNADSENYKRLATPRSSRVSAATASRVQALLDAGWTRKQIEDAGYASMETIKDVQSGNYEKASN